MILQSFGGSRAAYVSALSRRMRRCRSRAASSATSSVARACRRRCRAARRRPPRSRPSTSRTRICRCADHVEAAAVVARLEGAGLRDLRGRAGSHLHAEDRPGGDAAARAKARSGSSRSTTRSPSAPCRCARRRPRSQPRCAASSAARRSRTGPSQAALRAQHGDLRPRRSPAAGAVDLTSYLPFLRLG